MKLQLYVLTLLIFSSLVWTKDLSDYAYSAQLMDGNYELSGSVYLQNRDDGTVEVVLGDDFLTESGPDVQIFLAKDPDALGEKHFVADIGTGAGGINHFAGMETFVVDADVNLDEFRYVVFVCVAFKVGWGSGEIVPASGATSNHVAAVKSAQRDVQFQIKNGKINFPQMVQSVSLYSMNGKMIQQETNVSELNIGSLPKGVFVLSVENSSLLFKVQ